MLKYIARIKVYAMRGSVYVNGVTGLMAAKVALGSWLWGAVGFACVLMVVVAAMWVEDKMGLFEAEQDFMSSRNSFLRRIK